MSDQQPTDESGVTGSARAFDDLEANPRPVAPGIVPLRPSTAAARGGYASNPPDDAVHLRDYVKVVYKRRWTAITAFLVVFLTVAIYTFTTTPIYQAKVQILIEKEATNVVDFKEAIEQNRVADDYYQTQYRILQSRALARKTLDAASLWDNWQVDPKRQATTVRGMVMAPVALVSGWFKTAPPPPDPGSEETAAQSGAIDRFLAALQVSPLRNSRLVDVTFASPDPVLSARVANSVAAMYIAQNLEFKFLSSKEASDWLGERLGEQKKQVETSEQALQQYREQTDAVSLEDKQNIVVQKLADLNGAVTRAHTELIQKETLYNQVRSLQGDRAALDTLPAILSNTFIQQQKGELAELQRQQAQSSDKFGARHPEMVKIGLAIGIAEAKIQAEITKVIQATRNEYEAAKVQEQSQIAALEQQKRDAIALNRKGIGYGTLQRDAASNRQIFDSLMQRTKETGISSELKTSNIRVIDAAETPRAPASPNKPLNLLLGLFGGSLLALGLAFSFDYLDDRIKTPDEIGIHLGLPHLGLLPALNVKALASHYPLVSNGVPGNFAEAFRAVRTNVLFSSAQEGSRSVVVTSTGPGEGKSMVASNLAISLAQAGQRTLLMDADLRKPRAHQIFEMSQEPGLSNLLVGNAKASESIRESGVSGLWVIPSGRMPPNPAELLGSQRFRDFLVSLKDHFDWVIIDSPPVMAVTDAALVAHSATGVVFVVGAEMTSRHAAKTAVDQLQRVQARFVGAILNRVDLERNSYYYSQYYRREYSDYHQKTVAS